MATPSSPPLDFSRHTGTDTTLRIPVLTEDLPSDANLTTWQSHFGVKRKIEHGDDAMVISKSTADGGVTVDVTSQQFVVRLTDDDTSVTEGTYYWALKRTTSGSELVIRFGTLTFVQAVHRQ